MKLFLVAFAIFAYAHQCRADDPEADAMVQQWNGMMEKALKRKYGDSYTAGPSDDCCKACQNTEPPGKDKMSKLSDPTNSKKSEMIKDIYNTAFLTEMCTYFNATAACVRKCPDTQRRQYLKLLFAPIKYVCEDSHIVQNADCLGSVYENITMACLMNQCMEATGAAALAFTAYMDEPTKQSAEAVLALGCEFVKCNVKCTHEQRESKCGAQADTEVVEFYKRLSKTLEDLRYLSPSDYLVDIPAQCKKQ